MILHGFMFGYFFVFNITWCMCYRDYRLYFGGGSYSSVYVPLPMYVFPVVLVVYIPLFFFCFSLHIMFCVPIS